MCPILQTLPFQEVIDKRAAGASDVVAAAVALLTNRIGRLKSLMREGRVTVEVRQHMTGCAAIT